MNEEKKAWALIDQGYDGSFNGEAYGSVFFQNSNNSVRASDAFMQAVVEDGSWTTRAVLGGEPMDTYRARELMDLIAEGTHVCGDPGMQFDDTINANNTDSSNQVFGLGGDDRLVGVFRVLGHLLEPGVDLEQSLAQIGADLEFERDRARRRSERTR